MQFETTNIEHIAGVQNMFAYQLTVDFCAVCAAMVGYGPLAGTIPSQLGMYSANAFGIKKQPTGLGSADTQIIARQG